ncbi:helix-turn-helix domain-containing protein [Catenuloplanes atrovinosus]|uniref:Transcriptional regulator with XRE-family HTH domain n=1 Tax=Catenuloplanes atrovinosus TaxID=137266 RepID=A0AAE3YX96_9ACTN|nr:helix-turn-helix transcriptional regulator [Catenuloplanes atrovinosus]MDR7280912.1 transcriptional regulator with XRE-family HTH domain [Catenuloplanes atrovinosus]
MTIAAEPEPAGRVLRRWRERRRLSQLELSIRAEISTRHLSFIETGRSRPTPEMILRLADQLDMPLRERNAALLAGGYAPRYPRSELGAPELAEVRAALRSVLTGHEPYPALVLNRWWELLDGNAAVPPLVEGAAAHLLEPPVNVLRLTLHPDGLARRIVNLAQWRAHLLGQLRRRADHLGDDRLAGLHEELLAYPGGLDHAVPAQRVVLPLRLRVEGGEAALFSVASRVETAADVTVEELTIETFYPADAATAELFRTRLS